MVCIEYLDKLKSHIFTNTKYVCCTFIRFFSNARELRKDAGRVLDLAVEHVYRAISLGVELLVQSANDRVQSIHAAQPSAERGHAEIGRTNQFGG